MIYFHVLHCIIFRYHCDTAGLINVTALCDAGYYCSSEVDVSDPDGTTNTGVGG